MKKNKTAIADTLATILFSFISAEIIAETQRKQEERTNFCPVLQRFINFGKNLSQFSLIFFISAELMAEGHRGRRV